MMERNPFERGKSLLLKLSNQRIRYLSEDEIKRLVAECQPILHLHRIVTCALNTGMRKGEILSLKWGEIRNGFIYLEKTKREIPINAELERLFKEIRKEQGLTSEYVFTYAAPAFCQVDRAFHGVLEQGGN